MRLVLTLILSALSLAADCCPEQEFVRAFTARGRQYEVRFVEAGGANRSWGEDLVMRWRAPGSKRWHVVERVKQVRLERAVTLSDHRGRKIEALVVLSPGGSAQFISVVEIRKNPPSLKVLLDRALDKGGFKYRYDRAGRLLGFKFEYQAWHVSPDDLHGHVFTARNVAWDPSKHQFTTGPVSVDSESEKEASLVDVLRAIGSDELLGMEKTHEEKYKTYTYIYKPIGLLWGKTPAELRSSKRVKVVVKFRVLSASRTSRRSGPWMPGSAVGSALARSAVSRYNVGGGRS